MPNNPKVPDPQILRWRKKRKLHGIGVNKPRRRRTRRRDPRMSIKNIFWTEDES